MDLGQLQRKLIAVARATPPGDIVPYAFEKRVIAVLAARPAFDIWSFWSRALWRATAPCVGVALLLSAWALLHPVPRPTAGDLSQDFEHTLMAAVDQPEDVW